MMAAWAADHIKSALLTRSIFFLAKGMTMVKINYALLQFQISCLNQKQHFQ